MSENKTKPTDQNVEDYLQGVAHDRKRADSFKILALMQEITGEAPQMWGSSLIGFGKYHYKYESGREGNWFLTGFAPRKQNLTLYIMSGFAEYEDLLGKLGKYKTGKACLYINKLADIDEDILRKLIAKSVEYMRENHQ